MKKCIWHAKHKRISEYILITLILVLVIGLFILNFASNDIWADEACSLATVKNNFAKITYATAIDVHPPLYYWIIKLFFAFINIEPSDVDGMIVAGRIFSLFPLLLIFAISIFIGSVQKNKICFVFPFLICQYYPIVHYSCEIRMYSWTLLFVTVVGVAALTIRYQGGVYWCALVIGSLCVCYTHYFAVLPIAIIWIVLGIIHIHETNFLKRYCLAGCCVVVGYMPWLITFLKQFVNVHENYWIPQVGAAEIRYIISYFLSSNRWVRFFFYTVYLLIICYAVKLVRLQTKRVVWLVTMAFMPYFLIALSVGISIVYRPILVERYIVPALGIAAIGEILFLQNMYGAKKMCMRFVAVILSSMAIILSLHNVYTCYREEMFWDIEWNEMINDIKKCDSDTFLYIEGGQPIVRPLTVMFPNHIHICEDANMTEYNRLLFGTYNYDKQEISSKMFVITSLDYKLEGVDNLEYVGSYYTFNGNYSIYYRNEMTVSMAYSKLVCEL